MLASTSSAWNERLDAPASTSGYDEQQRNGGGPRQQQQQQQQQPLARPAPTRTMSHPAPTTSRRGRPEGRPPRPMNAWLLFRTAQLKLLQKENPDGLRKSQGELSKMIAEMWRNCDPEVRQSFEDLAKKRKDEFRLAYPDYRYGPTKEKPKINKTAAPERSTPRARPQLRVEAPREPSPNPQGGSHSSIYPSHHLSPPGGQYGTAPSHPASVLPTPTSASTSWPERSSLDYQTELSGAVEEAAQHPDYVYPPPMPSSAPATTSSFQSSLAFLGASIDSLAQPPSIYSRSPQDHHPRHAPAGEEDFHRTHVVHAPQQQHYGHASGTAVYDGSGTIATPSNRHLPPPVDIAHGEEYHYLPERYHQPARSGYPQLGNSVAQSYQSSYFSAPPPPTMYHDSAPADMVRPPHEAPNSASFTPISPHGPVQPYTTQQHAPEPAYDPRRSPYPIVGHPHYWNGAARQS
ncbi:hypothetical protein JCM10908_006144 [Rhodotorula pacifica]|uniref:uncharacterized protein n=1 Tax=Rhodotorula pacifica TaxID=1495444 RepID=UPI00317F33CB